MNIGKQEFINIFSTNFNYNIVRTPFGDGIEMPPKSAFIYSSITGAGYLDNPVYPFTPKGLLKLFYNVNDYKMVTGIFDNSILKNTPYIMSQAKIYLFASNKIIVPVEFSKENELTELLKSEFDNLKEPEKYVIQRIEINKKGNGMEPFMEYITAEYFKNKGYIVETQIPLAHSIGSPDFGGYGLKNIIDLISDNTSLNSGFHIIELALLRLFKEKNLINNMVSDNIIVGEAKTGTKIMEKQIQKYVNTGFFDYAIEIHPSKIQSTKGGFGLLTLDKNNTIKFYPPTLKYSVNANQKKYVNWLENYMKYYLIANFNNDEFFNFISKFTDFKISTQDEIINIINSIKIDNILQEVKKIGGF